MATTLAEQAKENAKDLPAPRAGMLSLEREFPFFMNRIRDEFDRLLDRFTREWPVPLEGFAEDGHWGMRVDDEDDALVLRLEAPGFEPGDFKLRLSGNRLILRGTRKTQKKEKERTFSEQRECYESFTLPPGLDQDKIQAVYSKGVLTVTLPKTEQGKGKQIPVKVA